MKKLLPLVLVFFVIVSVDAQALMMQKPTLVEALPDLRFVSPTEHFSIMLPGPDKMNGSYTFTRVSRGKFGVATDMWQFQKITLFVSHIAKTAASQMTHRDKNLILQKEYLEITRHGKDYLISDFPIKLGKFSGRQMIRYLPKVPNMPEILTHVFVGDREAFIVRAVYESGYEINKLAFRKIASFRIEGESGELDLNIASTLPQFPVAQRKGTDANDDRLKGRVRTVRLDTEFSSKNTGRERFSETHYSRSGNLERVVHYNDMLPLEVEEYGYLHGARVYKSKLLINYRFEKVPGVKYVRKHIAKNGDPRYEREYDYLYDNKRLLHEVNVWDSARAWQFQQIAFYSVNTVTWNTYGPGHKSTSRKIQTYDEKGNLIKEESFNPGDPEPVFSTTYIYDNFDREGNWTKRYANTKLSNSERIESTQYRTISYYK